MVETRKEDTILPPRCTTAHWAQNVVPWHLVEMQPTACAQCCISYSNFLNLNADPHSDSISWVLQLDSHHVFQVLWHECNCVSAARCGSAWVHKMVWQTERQRACCSDWKLLREYKHCNHVIGRLPTGFNSVMSYMMCYFVYNIIPI